MGGVKRKVPRKKSDLDCHSSANSLHCEQIKDLTQRNVEIIGALEEAANAKRSRTDHLADAISNFVGSMPFVYLHVLWFGAW